MKKKEILDTLSIVEKEHIVQAIEKLDREGVPGNRGSYLYDVIDPTTEKKYPPPYLLETAYAISSGKKLPKGFFDGIKNNGPHFQKIQDLGYKLETKWYDDLDLSSKIFSYKWIYKLSTAQWNKALDAGKIILDHLDIKKDDRKLVVSFRDDTTQRLGIIIGSKLVGGFYIEKDEIYLSFFVDENYDISVDSRLSLDDFKFANNIGKLIYLKLDDWQGEKDPLNKQVISDISNYYKDAPGTSWKNSHQPFMTDVIRSQGPRRRFLSFMRLNPQERLLDIYKYYLKTTGNKDELYKWEVGKQFQNNWDLKANDFGAMLKSVKLANLTSQQSGAFYREARKYPEEAKAFYTSVFDESKSISERLTWGRDEGNRLIKKWRPAWKSAGQDERMLSVLWAFNDLEKHAIFKSSFYTKYCELLEIKPASPGEKYEHYLDLVKDLVENYIEKDKELLSLQRDTLDPSKHINDPMHHLLAQNMLYRILDGYWTWDTESEDKANSSTNYWIFQGNPKIYDFVGAMHKGRVDTWTVSGHKDKMKVGDKAIMWLTGEHAGCYALGEITKEPYKNGPEHDEFWKAEDKSEWKAGLKMTHSLVTNPITREMQEGDQLLKNMKVGNQGSTFSATKEEYDTLLSLISSLGNKEIYHISPGSGGVEWTNFYDGEYMAISYHENDIGSLDSYTSRQSIADKAQLGTNTNTVQAIDLMRTIEKGSILLANNGVDELLGIGLVVGEYEYHDGTEYLHKRRVKWIVNKSWEYDRERLWGYSDAFRRDTFSRSNIGGFLLALFVADNPEYYQVLMDAGINPVVSLDEVETHFGYYLTKNAGKSKRHYLSGLNKINEICLSEGWVKESVYELHTRNRLLGLKEKLEQNSEYIERNEVGNNMFSSAFKKYTELIDELDIKYHWDKITSSNNSTSMNTILYGPPGTGKTYHLKKELFPLYTTKESAITREDYLSDFFKDLSWWMLLALVLYKEKKLKVGEIANHEFFQAKLRTTSISNVKPSIWSHLQTHTVLDCENVNTARTASNLVFYKSEDSTWELDEKGKEQILDTLYEMESSVDDFESKKDKEIKRYEFVTFHQSYAYEDFIEGIKPVMEEDSSGVIQYEIKDGLFKKLCQRAGNDPENPYAIFIDEINRGNVSSIFGELITLIENDKRLGGDNEMTATLPYSRATFGVPSNLHIYGTMNTADRSVEALDTALRRRFTFEEMLPDASKLKETIDEIKLSELLNVLNDRIEVLVDRDHTIGHAFFINDKNLNDLRNTFANKVIPLLQEYFYGDYGKMEMVIGSAFFEIKDTTKVKFAVKSEDFDPEGKVYHIVDVASKSVMTDEAFKDALTQLIKGA